MAHATFNRHAKDSTDTELQRHNGQEAQIVEEVDPRNHTHDPDEVEVMYRIRFRDGYEAHVFQEGLTDWRDDTFMDQDKPCVVRKIDYASPLEIASMFRGLSSDGRRNLRMFKLPSSSGSMNFLAAEVHPPRVSNINAALALLSDALDVWVDDYDQSKVESIMKHAKSTSFLTDEEADTLRFWTGIVRRSNPTEDEDTRPEFLYRQVPVSETVHDGSAPGLLGGRNLARFVGLNTLGNEGLTELTSITEVTHVLVEESQ